MCIPYIHAIQMYVSSITQIHNNVRRILTEENVLVYCTFSYQRLILVMILFLYNTFLSQPLSYICHYRAKILTCYFYFSNHLKTIRFCELRWQSQIPQNHETTFLSCKNHANGQTHMYDALQTHWICSQAASSHCYHVDVLCIENDVSQCIV